MKDISLYIHIPFCEKKCVYCAFNSFCAKDDVKEKYISLLCDEIKRRKLPRIVKTIYFGGGTPSTLSPAQFKRIYDCIYDNFDVYDNAEFTVECNPNSITEEFLKCYKSCRVNRLSIGVQSLSNKSLKKIGRLHDKQTALDKIKLARKYFDNISCDLIVGLEGEDGKALTGYAKQLLTLGIKHISCYFLEVYQNTPLFKMIEDKKYTPLTDEEQVSAFEKLSNYLIDAGMERYEISNFAYPQYESKHNTNYWKRGEYLGFGISAHSFIGGVRTENAASLDDYEKGITTSEKLTVKEEDEEKIMLGLRCNLGVNLNELKFDLKENPYYKDYIKQGILTEKEGLVKLNPMFYQISNTIISNLFEK